MNQTQTQTILQGVLTFILSIPTLLIKGLEEISVLIKTKVPRPLALPLKIVAAIIGVPLMIAFVLLEALSNKIRKNLKQREIDNNMSFQEFLRINLKNNFLVDGLVKVNVQLESKDFKNNIPTIYKGYVEALRILKEIESNVPYIVKRGMSILDLKIVILSKSLYEAKFKTGSGGCYTCWNQRIYIKLTSDTKWNKVVLHHETGHFIDFVVGYNVYSKIFDFKSSIDARLHRAYKEEVKHLRDYAKTNYCEFFAVAYEQKMIGGNMGNLEQTNDIINRYLKKFESHIEFLELQSSLGPLSLVD